MFSSDIMCFKSTTGHTHTKRTPPPDVLPVHVFNAPARVNGGRTAPGEEMRGGRPLEVCL